MYFWKIESLKNDLRKKALSESESFKYLLANTILVLVAIIPFGERDIWATYSAGITAIIAIVGLYYVYTCNQGREGKNFLSRFLSMSWVTTIRWTVCLALPTILLIAIFLILTQISDL